MSDQQQNLYIITPNGIMFEIAQDVTFDVQAALLQKAQQATCEEEMVRIAAEECDCDMEELWGCQFVITQNGDQLQFTDGRGVTTPLDTDNLLKFIIEYQI